MSQDVYPRRIVFQGLGALGVAAALAGCGGGSSDAGGAPSAGAAGQKLAVAADIPVGGGIVLQDRHIVITQPAKGEFKAFSSKCLHQGFDVSKVEGNTITCTIHGSTYDATTGKVTGPPAPAGGQLASVAIKVSGPDIVTA
ncbi:Rieske (2Fe-2S) protein [Nocardioides jiangxiensis]|uniref:Rieske (2Fe-2S) protein n=1 Tax=Nocardioides jiangxiensis TaxID=3064524 RepID=A0ABT9B569_9ACTN|nr:Rieske (2Fe-2S) protein [Nocardioides sp. WY-20]MDO7869535.1 Rieske (2Fe-2S) protein [Nocardioides sp. WY-20]